MFWGDRYGQVTDPFGHRWSFATHIKDVTSGDAGGDEGSCAPGRKSSSQFGCHAFKDVRPVADASLTEKPRGGIPGTVVAAQEPAPVGREHQGDPDRHAQRAGEVRDGGVACHHEIEMPHDRGGIHEGPRRQCRADRRSRSRESGLPPRRSARSPAPIAGSRAFTPGTWASDSNRTRGSERPRSVGFCRLPCQAMPILKPGSDRTSSRHVSTRAGAAA